jgi:hypothetical protein
MTIDRSYCLGKSIETTFEFSLRRSKTIVFPSAEMSKSLMRNSLLNFVSWRSRPVVRSTLKKFLCKSPPFNTTKDWLRGRNTNRLDPRVSPGLRIG